MYNFKLSQREKGAKTMNNNLDITLYCPVGHRMGKVYEYAKQQWEKDVEVSCASCSQHYPLSILTKVKT